MLLAIQRGLTLRLLRTSGTSWGDLPSVFLMAEAEPQKQTKSESRNVGCAGGDSGRRHSRDSASLSMSERALGSEGSTRCASMSRPGSRRRGQKRNRPAPHRVEVVSVVEVQLVRRCRHSASACCPLSTCVAWRMVTGPEPDCLTAGVLGHRGRAEQY